MWLVKGPRVGDKQPACHGFHPTEGEGILGCWDLARKLFA